jgi:AraC-like DNA-binding protein
MRGHSAAPKHHSVLAHWQASGHAGVRDALCAIYPSATGFRFDGDDSEARFECSIFSLAGLKLLRTYTSGYHCTGCSGSSDVLRVTLPARGAVEVISGRRGAVARAGASGVACVNETVGRRVQSDYVGFQMQIPMHVLLSSARALVGERFAIGDMESSIDLRTPVGASLLRTVGTLFSEVEHLRTAGLGQLACVSNSELLVNLAAAAVLPGLRERLGLPQKLVGGNTVEQARQFIEAHAAQPIRLGDLANLLGVSLRALQLGFRKRVGCTLSDYLFARRLELARAQLTAATDTMTVTQVALECGFVNVGAFAGRYYEAFGELPSHTLKRARGEGGSG